MKGKECLKAEIKVVNGKKVRYCETPLQQLMPCIVGWGNVNSDGISSCRDEGMKENCHNVVDVKDLRCPYCGSHLET